MMIQTDFVPTDIDCGDFQNIEPFYQALLDRAIESPEALEQWLIDAGELDAAVSEEQTLRYIAMTCQTDDEEKAKAYRAFEEEIVPRVKPLAFALNHKYVDCPHREALDTDRYHVLDRNIANEVELFREENIPLETQLSRLGQEYDTICGAMTVTVDGDELTMPQVTKLQEETDRPLRERAWRAMVERRARDADAIRGIFDKMRPLRQEVAQNTGFADFRDYSFRRMRRFDYTPATCEDFHRGVEQVVVPLYRKLLAERAASLGLDALRPWDLAVDPKGRPPLRPFENADELADGAHRIFNRLDPDLGVLFVELLDGTSLDLATRKGKAPGGYQATRDRIRKPFIFMNAAGTARDVETMLHEAGHAFHAILCRDEPLYQYRNGYGSEIAEVASMTMELFTHKYLDEFYTPGEADRHRGKHLEGIVQVLCWIAQIDAFQHWIYTHPDHTSDQRRDCWLALDDRFGPNVDWTGLEHFREEYWQRQLHLFSYPFYYIEYGIAQLGALGLWLQFRKDPGQALDNYRSALTLGGSKPLPDLFAAAGLTFAFGPDVLKDCIALVEAQLAE
ncbi:MAG: M3 family oligoendopeptidase [Phycisphaerales bacterium]|nr:M3 family oligoendopeptidase [Phycisphaerales bacterium]